MSRIYTTQGLKCAMEEFFTALDLYPYVEVEIYQRADLPRPTVRVGGNFKTNDEYISEIMDNAWENSK